MLSTENLSVLVNQKRQLQLKKRILLKIRKKSLYKNAALAQLVGSMYEGNVELTDTCRIAKAIWEKLISVFEQSSI